MKYVGIQTQIWRNNRNTVVLLCLFPVILLAMVYVFIMVLDWLGIFCSMRDYNMGSDYLQNTCNEFAAGDFHWPLIWDYFCVALPYTLGITAVWFLIAYFANTSIDGRVCKISDKEPNRRNPERIRKRHAEIIPNQRPVKIASGKFVAGILQVIRTHIIVAHTAKNTEPVQHHDEHIHHRQKNHWEQAKQNNSIPVIPPNLSLDTDVFHF